MPDRPQCEALTKRGERCANRAQPDSPYCGVHRGYSRDESADAPPPPPQPPTKPMFSRGRLGARPSAWLAIALFVVAILAVLGFAEPETQLAATIDLFVAIPAGIVSLVLGFRAFRRRHELTGSGLGVAALVCGWIGLLIPIASYAVGLNLRNEVRACNEQDAEWYAPVLRANDRANQAYIRISRRASPTDTKNLGGYLLSTRADLEVIAKVADAAEGLSPCSAEAKALQARYVKMGTAARSAVGSVPSVTSREPAWDAWERDLVAIDAAGAELTEEVARRIEEAGGG